MQNANLLSPAQGIQLKAFRQLDIAALVPAIYSTFFVESFSLESLCLYVDPHTDFLSYQDLQYLSFLCEANNLSLSSSIGGCEANRDLYELASLKVSSIQVTAVESTFSLKKFIDSYNHTYANPLSCSNPSVQFYPISKSSLLFLLESSNIRSMPCPASLVIDRNLLLNYFPDDTSLIDFINHSLSKSAMTLPYTVCGGIEQSEVLRLLDMYDCKRISTKMFNVNISSLKSKELLPDLIPALLILEMQVINLLIKSRSITSNRLSDRFSQLINYSQYSMLKLNQV
jgi:hypothetical protein